MTDRIICKRTETAVSNGSTDFGIRDKKGRVVGYTWSVVAVKYEPKPDQQYGYVLHAGEPMEFLEVTTSPTRDGKRYGPAFNRAQAQTMAEIEVIIARRTEAARKRDTKKFGVA